MLTWFPSGRDTQPLHLYFDGRVTWFYLTFNGREVQSYQVTTERKSEQSWTVPVSGLTHPHVAFIPRHPNNDGHSCRCPPRAHWTTALDIPRRGVSGQAGVYLISSRGPHHSPQSVALAYATSRHNGHLSPHLAEAWRWPVFKIVPVKRVWDDSYSCSKL